ncbi:hypothetical protein GCM10027592_39710 [Spirosoma flavus]
MNTFSINSLISPLRLFYQVAFMIALALFSSCSRSTSDEITKEASARVGKEPKGKARRVTWAYLRAMAATGQNPTIYKLLKDHNQLNPKGARSGCDPWMDECEEDNFDDGVQNTWRVDLPIQINGQTVWVSVVVTYEVSTGKAVSYGVAVYGNNAPSWSTYAPTTSYYNNGQSTVIGNIYYSYQQQIQYQLGGGLTGTGSIGPNSLIGSIGLEANVNTSIANGVTITQSGTIYVNASINMSSGWGSGTIQLNGPNGPTINYAIEPQ